ncbi:MAG: hypothetical protein ACM3WV_08650 [Bacillota bacterium]
MKRYRVLLLSSALLLVVALSSVYVFGATVGSHQVQAVLASSLSLTVANTLVTFDGNAFIGDPVVLLGSSSVAVNVRCTSNSNWELRVKADADLQTVDLLYSIAASKVTVDNGDGTDIPLSLADQTIASGGKTGAGGTTYNMLYELNLDGSEYGGTYNGNITYTVVAI